jgi:hypothetical protein
VTDTVHRINYSDLEYEILKIYGQKVNVLWDRDFSNGSFRDVIVNGEDELYDIDDEKHILEWLANPTEDLSIEYALHLLFQRELIPAGTYFIEISW